MRKWVSAVELVVRRLGRPGDLGWVVMAHGELYATEFGWDTDFEALVARIVADYAADHDPDREAAWIAELGGRRVGCVFCVAEDPVDGAGSAGGADGAGSAGGADRQTAKLRILLVDPSARGRGLGARLVEECVRFARGAGYRRLRLWTNDPLVAARRIYLDAGFVLTAEEPHHSFGVDMVGQTYELDLDAPAGKGRSRVASQR